jgi:hypothetical protein
MLFWKVSRKLRSFEIVGGGRSGSSFFFKRGDAIPGYPASFWRTVAFDLAPSHSPVCLAPGMIESVPSTNSEISSISSTNRPVIQWISCFPTSNSFHLWSTLPWFFKLSVTSREECTPRSFTDTNLPQDHPRDSRIGHKRRKTTFAFSWNTRCGHASRGHRARCVSLVSTPRRSLRWLDGENLISGRHC